MNTIFFLVKFFPEASHAAEFVDGKLFCKHVVCIQEKWRAPMILVVLTGMRARPFGCSQAK